VEAAVEVALLKDQYLLLLEFLTRKQEVVVVQRMPLE
jgi:hypothetical protein